MKKALAIAGLDPSGWAGILADMKTFRECGVEGFCVAAALTAQNRRRVTAKLPVPPGFLLKQISALLEEFKIDAVKVGMLANAQNVITVAKIIKTRGLKNIVLDPVLRSTSGYPLLDKKGVAAIKKMLPFVKVVTPNLEEASVLSGIEVKGVEEMEEAARRIFSLGAPFVLVKGGHLKGAPKDILYDGHGFHYYEGLRIKTDKRVLHGTGCVFSSAIAAGLAKGGVVKNAVRDAKAYLERVLVERRKAEK